MAREADRLDMLPANGITLLEIECAALAHDRNLRLLRDAAANRRMMPRMLEAAGTELANGGEAGDAEEAGVDVSPAGLR